MKNIYDYISKYQDEIKEINTIDAMIFSRITYIHFELIEDKLPIKIKDLKHLLEEVKTNSKDRKLIEMLSCSKRFQNIKIIRMKHVLDKEKEEHFLGITLSFNNDIFIAFRGTNKNIIDYKEDLNMSYMSIPSQIEAKDYVNSEKTLKRIYLGGHSKGGNLAMYAGIHANLVKRNQIKKIYNFDGPGFLVLDRDFYNMKSKIINFFPENDIVGRLMYNDNEIISIVTDKSGIEAHNMYHWSIINDDLERGELTKNSDEFHNSCIDLLENIDVSKRKIIIDYLFELILKGEIKGISTLNFDDIKKYISDVPKIDKNDKEKLLDFMKKFLKCLI